MYKNRIRALREDRDIKQVEIAKEEGVDKRVIGKRLDRIYNHLKNILKNLTDR